MTLFATPLLIFLVLIDLLMILFKRWKVATCIAVLSFLFNWYWQIYPFHLKAEASHEKTFRVVTYNIYPQVDSSESHTWQRQMFKEIKSIHPDILCLQEFPHHEMGWLEDYLCQYFSYTQEMESERRYLKWRLYSHYPMSNIKRYKPSEDLDTTNMSSAFKKSIRTHQIRQPFYSADIHLPTGDSVTVFSCHLQSNGYSTIRRSMGCGEFWFKGIGRYFDAIQSAGKLRVWEARNLRTIIDSIGANHPIIVAGDFNDLNRSETLATIQGNTLYDAWWNGGNGFGFTYSGFGLHLRLDHILYNDKLKLIDIKVVNSTLSDHSPLIAEFSLDND